MKRFRFSLRPVAVLRAHHELRAREAFASAVHAFVRSEQELAAARARLREFEQRMTESRRERFSAADEVLALAAYRRECTTVGEAEQAMRAAQQAMENRRTEYIEAHRKLEVVKRLEQKARTSHQRELLREEQAEFDDYAGRRFARRALESAPGTLSP